MMKMDAKLPSYRVVLFAGAAFQTMHQAALAAFLSLQAERRHPSDWSNSFLEKG
jgi:hypothetical protein